MKKLTTMVSGLFLVSVACLGQKNVVNYTMPGVGNTFVVSQPGTNNTATVTQSGTNNAAGLTQNGDRNGTELLQAGEKSSASVNVAGSRNSSLLSQGGLNGEVNVIQQGNDNGVYVLQASDNSEVYVEQAPIDGQQPSRNNVASVVQLAGERNRALVTQLGEGNRVDVLQQGNSTTYITQKGAENSVIVKQQSLNKSGFAGFVQDGQGNQARIEQVGGYYYFDRLLQKGGGNVGSIYQFNSEAEVVIEQQGTANEALIIQKNGVNLKTSITQEGTKNGVDFQEVNGKRSNTSIDQGGSGHRARINLGLSTGNNDIYLNLRQRGVDNKVEAFIDGVTSTSFDINQEGNKNYIGVDIKDQLYGLFKITQRGDFNKAKMEGLSGKGGAPGAGIIQDGNNNEAEIYQRPFQTDVYSEIFQKGADNRASISFDVDGNGQAFNRIYQSGSANFANIDIKGRTWGAAPGVSYGRDIYQVGSGNIAGIEASVKASDSNSTSKIIQQGNSNLALIAENDVYGNTTTINQMGNRNVASVELLGNNNTFTLNQLGDGNVYNGTITGSGSTVVINQP